MIDTKAIRERAEWAVAYGTHASDVSEGNEEAEQFGRDIVALLDNNDALVLALEELLEAVAAQREAEDESLRLPSLDPAWDAAAAAYEDACATTIVCERRAYDALRLAKGDGDD